MTPIITTSWAGLVRAIASPLRSAVLLDRPAWRFPGARWVHVADLVFSRERAPRSDPLIHQSTRSAACPPLAPDVLYGDIQDVAQVSVQLGEPA